MERFSFCKYKREKKEFILIYNFIDSQRQQNIFPSCLFSMVSLSKDISELNLIRCKKSQKGQGSKTFALWPMIMLSLLHDLHFLRADHANTHLVSLGFSYSEWGLIPSLYRYDQWKQSCFLSSALGITRLDQVTSVNLIASVKK